MQTHNRTDKVLRAKHQVASDFGALISDAEELLESTAKYSGESVNAARVKFQDTLDQVKGRLSDAQEAAVDKWNQTAAATNDYVRHNPWKTVGVAAVLALIVGVLLHRK